MSGKVVKREYAEGLRKKTGYKPYMGEPRYRKKRVLRKMGYTFEPDLRYPLAMIRVADNCAIFKDMKGRLQ